MELKHAISEEQYEELLDKYSKNALDEIKSSPAKVLNDDEYNRIIIKQQMNYFMRAFMLEISKAEVKLKK